MLIKISSINATNSSLLFINQWNLPSIQVLRHLISLSYPGRMVSLEQESISTAGALWS